ncbi:hypothetical protein [Bartonella vinsonii]|uniref:UDP-3-O-[3-hydroxymyristoyl] glucosamine N-acyltransferase n=1 Tax=Bartonella vinsonii TaxID=33047 RepID=A0A3S5C0F7_BARVI|nr:hypothetical protein [Bartonella vinsonii]VEJ45269.1 Uncharacterised protein [Bartonella vinsonii]VEJ46014.1 Uncharacterised protein [Bartonella vinsonii]VEJ46165.1 Uncharacterised protein [Bartonella vinsonii]
MTSTVVTKKYEFINETRLFANRTLYRIKALRNFSDVKAGQLGGFIENENNLSHDGNCWVYDNALVLNPAHVSQDAKVFNNSVIAGFVYGKACVFGKAIIFDHAHVYGNARIYDHARVINHLHVCEYANLHGMVMILEKTSDDIETRAYVEQLSHNELRIFWLRNKALLNI